MFVHREYLKKNRLLNTIANLSLGNMTNKVALEFGPDYYISSY